MVNTIDVKVSDLLDKPVAGMVIQVTNPRFMKEGFMFPPAPPMWRMIKSVRVEKNDQTGSDFVTIRWEPEEHDELTYSGMINEPERLEYFQVQLTVNDYNKLF